MNSTLTAATTLLTDDPRSACWFVDETLAGAYADVDGLVPASAGSPVALLADKRYLDYTRRNRLLNSETTAFGGFFAVRTAVAAYSGSLPSAVLSAISIIPDVTSSTHVLQLALPTVLKPTGSFMAFSVFAKATGYNYLRLNCIGAGVANSFAVFDLAAGTVYSSTQNLPVIITPQGNGWYRCGIAVLIVDGAQSITVQCLVMSTPTTQSFAGDGVSGLALSGVQIELASLPSDYQRVLGSWAESLPGYPAYQPTAASQPTLVAESNGLYSLLFDGVDDYLITSHKLTATLNLSLIGLGASSIADRILFGGLTSNANSRFYLGANTALEASAGLYSKSPTLLRSPDLISSPHLMAVVLDQNSAEFSLDNVFKVSSTITSSVTLAVNYLGCLNSNGTPAKFWAGKLYAVGVANKALDAAALTTVLKAFGGFASLAIPSRGLGVFPASLCPTGGTTPQSHSPTLVSESQSLRLQVRTLGAQRWSISYSWDKIPRTLGQKLLAYLNTLRGRYASFELPLFGGDGGTAKVTTGALVVSAAASVGSSQVAVSGFTLADEGLAVGDFIRFADHSKLYQLTQDALASGGVALLEIFPPLRTAVAVAEAVTYKGVTIKVALDQDTLETQLDTAQRISVTIKCLEVLP